MQIKSVDREKELKKVLKNPRIANRVQELNLSLEQQYDALPIFIDMNIEKDDENTKFITSFYLTKTGSIKKQQVLSTFGKKVNYINNFLTRDTTFIEENSEGKFIKEDSRKDLVITLSDIINNKRKKGVYLHGEMGIGKTYIFKWIAKKIAKKGKTVGFVNVIDLIEKVKHTFNDDEISIEPRIKILKEVDFLFIDDIGSEKIASWFRDNILFVILNERMQRQKTTFFTSNYSYEELHKIQSRTSNQKYPDFDRSKRLTPRMHPDAGEGKHVRVGIFRGLADWRADFSKKSADH